MINCLPSTGKIHELLEILFMLEYLKDMHLSHPYFPSLVAISDTVDKHDLRHMPIKIGKEKIDQISLPCIVPAYIFFNPYNIHYKLNIIRVKKPLLLNKDPPLC
jgi:hypothetical protein